MRDIFKDLRPILVGFSGLSIYVWYGPVAQRLEQGTHNSRQSFCAGFHWVAQRCRC